MVFIFLNKGTTFLLWMVENYRVMAEQYTINEKSLQ
jgi:hypothetical protein